MDNQKLSARVEALEGPCRKCDCLIENTLGLAKFERDPRVIYGDAYYNRVEPKPYTASIDAAMSLVPVHRAFEVLMAAINSSQAHADWRKVLPAHICIHELRARSADNG